jgi:hypothetical protein
MTRHLETGPLGCETGLHPSSPGGPPLRPAGAPLDRRIPMPLSVICGRCKSLVEIVDRRYAAQEIRPGETCPIARSIYRPERIHRSGPSGPPGIELVAIRRNPEPRGLRPRP